MLDWLFERKAPEDGDTQIVDLRYDRPLLAVTMILMGIGVVMVYSASVVTARNETMFLEKQVIFCALSLVAMASWQIFILAS